VRVHREHHPRRELGLDALADLRELDHRHPDRVPGDVAEVVAAVGEALRDGAVDVVRARAGAHRRRRGRVVLLVRLEHAPHLVARLAERARDLDPVAAGARDLERRQAERVEHEVAARDRELRPREHHVHRQPAAALLDEEALGGRHRLGSRFPGRPGVAERVEAVGVDADALADGLELLVRLDRASEVELDVPRHEVDAVGERAVVAHRHRVVEPVRADAAACQPLREPVPGPVDEDLLLDPRRPVLADVARLRREHQRGLTLERQQHVGVAVDDLEPREVRDGALEARVLAPRHERRVEAVARERLPHVPVPPLDVRRAHCRHAASVPLMSATIASLSGVGTPCSRPKRAMPPLR
jgi:hypothetical protein